MLKRAFKAVKGAAPEITILKRSQFFYYLYSLFSTGAKKVSLIVFFQRENNNFIFSREKSNLVFFVPEACDLVKSFQEDEVLSYLGLSSILTILLAMALRY